MRSIPARTAGRACPVLPNATGATCDTWSPGALPPRPHGQPPQNARRSPQPAGGTITKSHTRGDRGMDRDRGMDGNLTFSPPSELKGKCSSAPWTFEASNPPPLPPWGLCRGGGLVPAPGFTLAYPPLAHQHRRVTYRVVQCGRTVLIARVRPRGIPPLNGALSHHRTTSVPNSWLGWTLIAVDLPHPAAQDTACCIVIWLTLFHPFGSHRWGLMTMKHKWRWSQFYPSASMILFLLLHVKSAL